MAQIFPVGPKFRVMPAQDGMILAYGNTSDENPSGAFSMQFCPSEDFVGEFAVLGRVPGISTSDTSVPWMAFPYRLFSLNNVAQDFTTARTAVISGTTAIHIPANGWAVGLLVNCTAGSCMIYSAHMEGAAAP